MADGAVPGLKSHYGVGPVEQEGDEAGAEDSLGLTAAEARLILVAVGSLLSCLVLGGAALVLRSSAANSGLSIAALILLIAAAVSASAVDALVSRRLLGSDANRLDSVAKRARVRRRIYSPSGVRGAMDALRR